MKTKPNTLVGIQHDINRAYDSRADIMGNIWAFRSLERHLDMLCSRIGKRALGSSGEKAAAGYILNEFRSYGLDKVYKDDFVFNAWKRGKACLTVFGPDKRRFSLTAMGYSPSTPDGGLKGEMVIVESVLIKKQKSLTGKIALIIPEEAGKGVRVEHSSITVRRAAASGARAVILASPKARTVSGSFMNMAAPIPAALIAREDALWLKNQSSNGGGLAVNLHIKNKTGRQSVSYNIIGELTGRLWPDEKIMITAHYDSQDNTVGALDDASGTAAVMELARLFSKCRERPARTIQFVCFSGEEMGLLGSNAYAQSHLRELRNIVLMLAIDPAGSTNYWVGGFAGMLQWLSRFASTAGWQNRAERYVAYNTDCFPFLMRGVPSVWMMSRERRGWLFDTAYLTYGHTERDTLDKVDVFDVKEAMTVVADTCLCLANARTRPDYYHNQRQVRQWFNRDSCLVDTLKNGGLWKLIK